MCDKMKLTMLFYYLRWIYLDAGSEDGWLEGSDISLIFQSRSTKDYHEEMDSQVFEQWLRYNIWFQVREWPTVKQ